MPFMWQGSPPPMRGKADLVRSFERTAGITPAYAGKSFDHESIVLFVQDHPRLCGEKWTRWRRISTYIGSPPPMRGKGPKSPINANGSRITPAYAGKSRGGVETITATEDHPRLCGEKRHLYG